MPYLVVQAFLVVGLDLLAFQFDLEFLEQVLWFLLAQQLVVLHLVFALVPLVKQVLVLALVHHQLEELELPFLHSLAFLWLLVLACLVERVLVVALAHRQLEELELPLLHSQAFQVLLVLACLVEQVLVVVPYLVGFGIGLDMVGYHSY